MKTPWLILPTRWFLTACVLLVGASVLAQNAPITVAVDATKPDLLAEILKPLTPAPAGGAASQ